MPQLNYAILSLGAFHPVRPESFLPQRTFQKGNAWKRKQTNKLVSMLVSLLSFQEKIERKKVSWCVVDNCSLPPRCCGIECDQKSAITQCLSEQVVLRVPCWQVPEVPVSPYLIHAG